MFFFYTLYVASTTFLQAAQLWRGATKARPHIAHKARLKAPHKPQGKDFVMFHVWHVHPHMFQNLFLSPNGQRTQFQCILKKAITTLGKWKIETSLSSWVTQLTHESFTLLMSKSTHSWFIYIKIVCFFSLSHVKKRFAQQPTCRSPLLTEFDHSHHTISRVQDAMMHQHFQKLPASSPSQQPANTCINSQLCSSVISSVECISSSKCVTQPPLLLLHQRMPTCLLRTQWKTQNVLLCRKRQECTRMR